MLSRHPIGGEICTKNWLGYLAWNDSTVNRGWKMEVSVFMLHMTLKLVPNWVSVILINGPV